jgi:hypothetical protein
MLSMLPATYQKIQYGVVLVSRFVHDWSRLSGYWRCICARSYYGDKPQAVHSTQQKTKEVQTGFGCGIHCYDCGNGKNATPLHFSLIRLAPHSLVIRFMDLQIFSVTTIFATSIIYSLNIIKIPTNAYHEIACMLDTGEKMSACHCKVTL